MLALMPVVIISFVSERIHQVTQEGNWQELATNSLGSLLAILYPETHLLVIAGLLFIGRWDGIRISELIRFKHLPKDQKQQLLGINSRNRNLVYQHNEKGLLRLAADKLASKEALKLEGIPVPDTLFVIEGQKEINQFICY